MNGGDGKTDRVKTLVSRYWYVALMGLMVIGMPSFLPVAVVGWIVWWEQREIERGHPPGLQGVFGHRLKHLWSRWWTWALLVASVPLVLTGILWLNLRSSEPPREVLRKWARDTAVPDARPVMNAEILAWEKKYGPAPWMREAAESRTPDWVDAFGLHPHGREFIEKKLKSAEDALKEWDVIAARGRFERESVPAGVSASGANLLWERLTRLSLMQARVSGVEGRRDALDSIRAASRSAAPYKDMGVLETMVAVASRHLSYITLQEILQQAPSHEVSEASLRLVSEMHASDPRWSHRARLAGREGSGSNARGLARFLDDVGTRSAKVEQAVNAITLSWASSRSRQVSPAPLPSIAVGILTPWLVPEWTYRPPILSRWTQIPATEAVLSAWLDKHPDLGERAGLPNSLRRRLNGRQNVAMLGEISFNDLEARTRTVNAATLGWLLDAGFSAQVYHHDHGAWPTNSSELCKCYSHDFEEPARVDGEVPTRIRAPRLGMVPITGDNLAAFLGREFRPFRATALGPAPGETDRLRARLSLNLDADSPHVAPYLAEGLAMSGRNVTDVTVNLVPCVHDPNPPFGTGFPAPDGTEVRLASGEVMRGSGRSDEEPVPTPQTQAKDWQVPIPLHSDGRLAREIEERITRAVPGQCLDSVEVGVEFPGTAFAVWAPGPSGGPGNASVLYDPTNGTASAGDLIVFPGTPKPTAEEARP